MPVSQMSKAIQHLHKTVVVQEAADGHLLECFVSRHEHAALEVLVRRHGPMVWGVCRRVLKNYHDAEDAFQATFLVLVRKAASIAPKEMVGNWLYGVAHQTALKARATAAKRTKRECRVATMPEASGEEQEVWSDLHAFLDQELSKLPDKFRAAILLCDLEGRTQKEAARQIGCPEGTVATHLARGRALLAKRMARHGLAVSSVSVAAVLAQSASACVPASVVSSTMSTVTLFAAGHGAMISVKVAALTEGMLKTMWLAKLKIALVAVLAFVILGVSAGAYTLSVAGNEQLETRKQEDSRPAQKGEPTEDWHPFAKNQLVAVEIERSLYDVKGEKHFLMAVRLTNLTDVEIGVDLRGRHPGIYPNQWVVSNKDLRSIIDERRVTHLLPDKDKLRADFNANRLTRISAGKSIVVYTEFSGSGRADVDRCKGKYFIVSMDGKLVATDGKTVETISCAWTSPKTLATDVVLPFPVTWKVPAAKIENDPKKVETDQEKMLGTWKVVSADSNGKSVLDEGTEGDTTVITANTITMNCISGGRLVLDYRLDPSQEPKAIDVTPHKPDPSASDVLMGIFDVIVDKLTVCFSRNVAPGAARPSKFSADERGDRFYVLERIPAAKAKEQPKVDVGKNPLDPKLLAKLAVQMRSKDWDERSAAVSALAKLLAATSDGKTDFGPVIEPLFENAGWGGIASHNARTAEDSLVRVGRQATPALRQRLKSTDAHDRRVAAELLVRIGPPDAALVALLRPLLTDRDDYVRKAAIDGLGTLGAPAKGAIDDLEEAATNDLNLTRRVAARIALIRIAGVSDERVRALAAFLEMKDNLKDEAKGDKDQSRKEAAAYAASALGELGPKAKAAEAQLLASLQNPEVRLTAARTLGEISSNSPEAVNTLIDVLKNDAAREARRSAAGALGAFGPAAKAAIPVLREAMKGDAKGGWWVAADALAKIGGAEVVPALIEALANPDADVRLTSMRGLGKLGVVARPARMALEKARLEDTRESNRAAAAEALQKIEKALPTMK